MPKLIGIPASPGVAIGKVHPIDRRRARVPRYHIAAEQVVSELTRLDHAVRDSVEQLRAIRESLGEGEQGDILDAHRMMADDPSILEGARSLVRDELLNAEWAVRRTFREISEKLGNDGYLAERRADLDEVSDRIIQNLVGEAPTTHLEQPPQDAIVVAYDLATADAAVLLSGGRVKGLVTDFGSKTSHTAILARALEVPAVVGAGQASELCRTGDSIALDGNTGEVLISPDPADIVRFEAARAEAKFREAALMEERDLPAVTLDGRRVGLWANIEFPEEIPSVLAHGGEGVGLYRTEFLYLNREELPSEEEHFKAYASILSQMGDRPVVIRTLDLGGDKLPIGHRSHEPNPALGLRAIRFTLRHPQLFRTQVRAIWRASTLGRLRIMLPKATPTRCATRSPTPCWTSACGRIAGAGWRWRPRLPRSPRTAWRASATSSPSGRTTSSSTRWPSTAPTATWRTSTGRSTSGSSAWCRARSRGPRRGASRLRCAARWPAIPPMPWCCSPWGSTCSR